MRITVSGLPGSGTTTLARRLAEFRGIPLVSAGEVFRQMAQERGIDLAAFGALAEKNPEIDRGIDRRQQEIAGNHQHVILEGRLSGWMVRDADVKVWLKAPLACRVQRIHERDGIADLSAAEQMTLAREACEAQRYRTYYSIDIGDLSIYDIVLDSSRWDPDQLLDIVGVAVREVRKA